MTEKVLNKPMYADEIVKIFRSGLPKDELIEKISDYHTSDIADALEKMTVDERKALYPVLGVELVAEIFSYIEDSEEYLKEINSDKVANLLSEMDSDDAVDILEKLGDDDRKRIVAFLDNDAKQDVRMISGRQCASWFRRQVKMITSIRFTLLTTTTVFSALLI